MRLHLVDGTYELFRSHFSPRPGRASPAGMDIKATVGVMGAVLALLADADERVTHVAIAFDNPIESWRNERFSGYKSSAGVDAELLAQFDLVERACRALGVTVWSMDSHEADDALATAAARWRDDVEQVRILTPDKDLGQAVVGRKVVQVDRMRDREFDEDGVIDRLGVSPASVPDYLALVGDTADGIPGLRGFGAKSAAAVLRRYTTLEAIPRDGSWDVQVRGAARLQQTLRDGFDDALLYRELATLATDLPLPERLEDLQWRGAYRDPYLDLCDELGVTTLRDQPTAWV